MQANLKDLAAGTLFVAIGLFFGLDSLLHLRIGRAFSMGPGYFPLIMASVLVGFGALIAVRAIGKPAEPVGKVSWRGVGLVTASIVFFALTVRGLGLAPSLLGSVLMAAQSSGAMSWRSSAVLAAVLTVFSVAVFIYLLGLPYPVFGSWIAR